MAGDRRGHAQTRIGVDIGRADEALHQLVGDVIVLGQQLAGEIEGDRIRAVLRDGARESRRRRGSSASSQTIALRARRRSGAASDAAAASRGPASRRAPSPSSTAGRNSPDARDRRQSPRRRAHRAWPARRSRRRNRGRWCAPPADAARARLRSSINVLLIAALLLQLGDEGRRLLPACARRAGRRCRPARARRPSPCAGVAADIDVRAVGEPRPQIAADLAHAVLHVDLLVAVARPGERQPRQQAGSDRIALNSSS